MANKLYLLLMAALGLVSAYRYPDLPPGPYCGTIGAQCCSNRQDSCSHAILGTLCYCDQFCNRTLSHDDCCPDYEEVCLGLLPPPENIGESCKENGKSYFPPEKIMRDCNTCKCEPKAPGKADWVCEEDPCMMSTEVIDNVNRGGYRWRAANYTQFYGRKLKQAMVYKLGTLPLSAETRRMGPIRHNKDVFYPMNFDARDAWPGYISPIVDQEWCGSDWAVAIAGVMSDRFAIQSNGAENLRMSPQSLLSCNRRSQRGCDGGNVDVAWNFAKSQGLVDEDCYPYEGKASPCRLRSKAGLIENGCVPPASVPQRTSRYKVGPPGRLQKEYDIMYDIMQSGPVHAIMTVYQDFFHYRDGVYRRSGFGNNQLQGLHSVRIIGWGEERGEKYWLVANSWGAWWGENGYFKIARGENESGIESFVVTILCDVTESYRKK
ncbi:unnamed protein product [Chilo suppressalis]|uniref:SMB domain-containing protein n=1 Tax=Chilo suppressalis TaxID=168631 RepID=A0ABN8B4P1_CHISP|nr:hypothetical protein evm_008412 [Chilo suppressalis]CAH0403075.1 unnamed protein product [Chilo suppressalis]